MSRKTTSILLLVIAAFLALGVGIFLWMQFGADRTNAKSADATPTLSAHSDGFTVDRSGGNFEISMEGGTAATLTFPAGATASTAVEAKAITGLSNLPAGVSFVTGVSLSPDGSSFARYATLELPIPGGHAAADPETLYAFRYEGTGQNLQLYPLKVRDGNAVINITGFSGYGLLHIEIDPRDLPVPSDVGDLAKHDIALISNVDIFLDEIRPVTFESISEILVEWYHAEVEPNLNAALSDDRLAISAITNWLDWLGTAQATGVDTMYQLADAEALAKQLVETALQNTADRCRATLDPEEGVRLMQLASIAELLGFAEESSFQLAINAASTCLQFTLEIESTMSDELGHISASGSGALLTDPDTFQLAGEGMIQEETSFIFGGSMCVAEPNPSYSFTILPLDLSTAVGDSSQSSLELVFVIGDNPDREWICIDEFVDSTYGGPYNRWQELFIDAHEDEEIPWSVAGDVLNFVIADWDFSSTEEGVIARKSYDRVVSGITEHTVFTLKRGGS